MVVAGVVWERIKCLLLESLEEVVEVVMVEVVVLKGVIVRSASNKYHRKQSQNFGGKLSMLSRSKGVAVLHLLFHNRSGDCVDR